MTAVPITGRTYFSGTWTVAFPRVPVHVHVGSALHFAFRPTQPLWTSQRPRRSAQCPSFLSGPRWKRWKRWRSTRIVGSGTRTSTPSGTSLNPGLNQGASDGPCVLEQPKWKPKIGQVAQRSRRTAPKPCHTSAPTAAGLGLKGREVRGGPQPATQSKACPTKPQPRDGDRGIERRATSRHCKSHSSPTHSAARTVQWWPGSPTRRLVADS